MKTNQFLVTANDFFEKATALLETKNKDYANENDVFSNFDKLAQIAKILDLDVRKKEHGALYSIVDKLIRIRNLENKKPNHESVKDSCLDGVNYFVLYYGMKTEEKEK